MLLPTSGPKWSSLAITLITALLCINSAFAHTEPPILRTLAYPAGSAQNQTIQLPWPRSRSQLPQLQPDQVPTGVTIKLRGWTHNKSALRLVISIPAQMAPGLYFAKFSLKPQADAAQQVTLRLAVQALYIGLSGTDSHHGIVAESTNGKRLSGISRRLSAGVVDQGKQGVSSIAYNPLNETLFIYAGGSEYLTNVATLNGQFLPSPIPRKVISSSVPDFIDWAGGHDFLWSKESSWVLTDRGVVVSRIRDKLALDGASSLPSVARIIPSAATADAQTGILYLCNGNKQIHHSPWIYEFNLQGKYLGAFTDPQFGRVMALAYNPWNQEIYVMGQSHSVFSPTVSIQAYTSQGQPVTEASGAFQGGRLLATPISQTVLSANPLNGHLYYLNHQVIDVYSPNGRLLRTLPTPAGANNITFVPGYLTTQPISSAVAAIAPTSPSANAAITQLRGAPAVVSPSLGSCPPGYLCVPKHKTTAASSPHSFNQSANRTDNAVMNASNLARSISDLAKNLP